jgi:hypothetical protein
VLACHYDTAQHVLRLLAECTASRYGRYLWIYWIRNLWQPTRGGPPAWVFGGKLAAPHHKKQVLKMLYGGPDFSSSCAHGNEPSGSIKSANFLTSWATVNFLGRILLHGVSYRRHLIKSWYTLLYDLSILRKCWLIKSNVWYVSSLSDAHWEHGLVRVHDYECMCAVCTHSRWPFIVAWFLLKLPDITFHEIPFSRSQIITYGQTWRIW